MTKITATQAWSPVAFGVVSKTGTQTHGVSMRSVFYHFPIKWRQLGHYVQSVCDNTTFNCDKLEKITNLLLSTYIEIHIATFI